MREEGSLCLEGWGERAEGEGWGRVKERGPGGGGVIEMLVRLFRDIGGIGGGGLFLDYKFRERSGGKREVEFF